MKNIHVAVSPLSNTIFAGTVNKKGNTWLGDKTDVTVESLVAVAKHVIEFGDAVIISTEDGTPEYKITVEKL